MIFIEIDGECMACGRDVKPQGCPGDFHSELEVSADWKSASRIVNVKIVKLLPLSGA